MRVTASAPGKLFLLGEYAVLEGAPALVAAVDRRAQVHLAPAEDSHWRLHAPDIGVPDLLLEADGRLPSGLTAAQTQGLSVYAAAQVEYLDGRGLPPHTIAIDSQGFSHSGGKLGLGASAAVAAALSAAFGALAGSASSATTDQAAAAAQVHRAAQSGAGSGADVAAAVYGGVIQYHIHKAPESLTWPAGLQIHPVITGRGADTRRLLKQIAEWRNGDAQGYDRHLQELTELAVSGTQAWRAGQALRFVDCAGAYGQALRQLGQAAGVAIFTPAHHQLTDIAQAANAVFKTSGAGGGDLGLMMTTPDSDLGKLNYDLEQAGFTRLALTFNAPGLRVAHQ